MRPGAIGEKAAQAGSKSSPPSFRYASSVDVSSPERTFRLSRFGRCALHHASAPALSPTRPAPRLGARHEFAGARTGRERREIAGVERMEPKPVAPGPDYPAVVRIIPETHNVAFLEVLAVLEGLAKGRIVIYLSVCVKLGGGRHGPLPASSVDLNEHRARGSCLARSFVGPRTDRRRCGRPRPMRGETERACRMVALRTASSRCGRPRRKIKSAKIGMG